MLEEFKVFPSFILRYCTIRPIPDTSICHCLLLSHPGPAEGLKTSTRFTLYYPNHQLEIQSTNYDKGIEPFYTRLLVLVYNI